MKSHRFLLAAWLTICTVAIVGIDTPKSYAQATGALAKAQAAFDQAQQDYLQGKYDEAAQGFQDAYTARNFPQFLYNIGAAFHMKGKKNSDVAAYGKAVEFYKRYLDEDKQASDRPKVEKAIAIIEAEIQRLAVTPAPGPGSGSGSGSALPAPPPAPSAAMQQLGDAKVRGLVVIESEPQNATIYLDDKKRGAFATTPWSGSLDGEHKIIIEKKGYKLNESTIQADPSKLFVLKASMSEEGYLGWVEFSSNIEKSDIYMDDKSIGAIGKTPLAQNVKPGKHVFYISSEGYNEYRQEIEILPGQTYTIKADLSGTPIGKVNVQGLGIEDSSIWVDGQRLCERGPCLKGIPQGDHVVEVQRPGFKPYRRRVQIQAKTETQIKVALAPEPSRSDAIVAYILAAGFTGGGVYLGLQANKYKDQLTNEIRDGNPPPDSNDPRFLKGKIFAIAANVSFGLGALTALGAIYYTFREKGAPSTGLIDVRALALQPQIGPGYAGIGMETHW